MSLHVESQMSLPGPVYTLLWSYWEMRHPAPSPAFAMNQLFWLISGESVPSVAAYTAKFRSHWSTSTSSASGTAPPPLAQPASQVFSL